MSRFATMESDFDDAKDLSAARKVAHQGADRANRAKFVGQPGRFQLMAHRHLTMEAKDRPTSSGDHDNREHVLEDTDYHRAASPRAGGPAGSG